MTTIKFRRDTSANWTSVNPIPAQGEPCYETDTGKLKIGNGSDNYVTLPYVSDGGGSSGDLPIATATTLGGVKIGNNLSITEDGTLSATGGSSGTTDYTQLENKPQINSVELTGNKTLNDLGIQPKGNYATTADIPTKTSELTNDSGFLTEAPIPTNMVTTDTDQTISGVKTFTNGVTTASIYPADEITFNSTSTSRYINNVDSIAGGYHGQNGYLTFKGDTRLVGDNKLILDGRTGGLKLTAASSANITCENTLIAPNIVTTANGTIKLTHPTNAANGLMTISNNYGQLSISTTSDGINLLSIARGTLYVTIDADKIVTKDVDGNLRNYINSQNIDTTYMKWDSSTGKLKVDTAAVAGLAMPSDKCINLTLGASGTTYTAPANGYVYLSKKAGVDNAYIDISTSMLEYIQYSPSLDGSCVGFIPVKKGGTFTVTYNATGITWAFRFVCAQGSESEAS